MKFTKCFIVLGLCIVTGACNIDGPSIRIGDYENQLALWNNQNMLDYRLLLYFYGYNDSGLAKAVVTVRNGIPESSDPPEWLASGEKSTIPEFFSFIKESQNKIKNGGSLFARYDTEYHYPEVITARVGGGIIASIQNTEPDWSWEIELRPLVERVREAWDSQNMQDYQLLLRYSDYDGLQRKAVIIVKNGVPESSDPPEWLARGEKSTIPDFFSLIKKEEEEEKLSRGFLRVSYDDVYHYPTNIAIPAGTSRRIRWSLILKPLGGEPETEGGEE